MTLVSRQSPLESDQKALIVGRAEVVQRLVRILSLTTLAVSIVFWLGWLVSSSHLQLLVLAGLNFVLAASGFYYRARPHRQPPAGMIYLVLGLFGGVLAVYPLLLPTLLPVTAAGLIINFALGHLLLEAKPPRLFGAMGLAVFGVDLILALTIAPGWFTALDSALAVTLTGLVSVLALGGAAAVIEQIWLDREANFHRWQLAERQLEQQTQMEQKIRSEAERLIAEAYQASELAQQRRDAERQAKEHLEQTLARYSTFLDQIAVGNLSARLALNGHDDALSGLGHNLNRLAERLSEMTSQVRTATANIGAAATEILAATRQQATGTYQQSTAITQTATAISEVKTVVEQALIRAQAVADQAQRTREISLAGQHAVLSTVEGMSQIKERVESIAENILALSEQTQQISEIIATVNELAAQSNLLALNASVEAARAGEHGRGFAVVAVEVRNLAEQSKQATAQVKAILNEIQRATNGAVMALEEGTLEVNIGTDLTGRVGDSIDQLAGSIAENADAARQILATAQQQTKGMEQISVAIENIKQAMLQGSASTRQTEKSAQNLSAVAQHLETIVGRYPM